MQYNLKHLGVHKTQPVYLMLFLVIVKTLGTRSNFLPYSNLFDNMISAVVLFLALYAIYIEKYNRRNLFIYILVGLLALYSAVITGMMLLPVTVLIILSIRQESIHEVASFMYFWKIRFFILHSMLAFIFAPIGLSSIGGIYQTDRRYRFNFGFCFAGQFADYVLDLMVLWIICNYGRIKRKTYAILLFITVLTYICSDSKVCLGASCILIFLVYLIKHTTKYDKVIKLCAQFSIPVLTVFVFYTIDSFSKGEVWAHFIDKILTTRIRLNGYLYDLYGVTWLGQKIDSYRGEYSEVWQSTGSTFDCVYPWLVIEMGAIWLVFIAVSFYILTKREDSLMNCLLLVWALGVLIDTDYLYGTCSFIILLISLVFTKDKRVFDEKRIVYDKA